MIYIIDAETKENRRSAPSSSPPYEAAEEGEVYDHEYRDPLTVNMPPS